MEWKYNSYRNGVVLPAGKPKSTKKITGTRLGAIVNLNKWSTPFQMWCEITKLATPPFEDTKYTLAGKVIEEKIIEYTRSQIMDDVLSPEQYFGNCYKDMKYDFYPDEKIFGGMWDGLIVDPDGKEIGVVECKTSSRPQDWVDGVPDYYLIQALMYAHLLGVKEVIVPVSFLSDEDYYHPENFKCTNENTKLYFTDTNQLIDCMGEPCTIEDIINIATDWYDTFIETGISPEFDEEADKDYLDIMRTAIPSNDKSLDKLISEVTRISYEIETIKKETGLSAKEKELKILKDAVKQELISGITDTVDTVEYGTFKLTSKVKQSADIDRLIADGLNEYITEETTYTLSNRKNKE